MNVSLEKSTAVNAVIKATIVQADYQPEIDKKIKEYSRKMPMKGFRPGKVPVALIQKMYGKSILIDEVNERLAKEVNNYIKENKLPLVGDPIPNREQAAKIDWDTQHDFEFEYEIGLSGEFMIDYDTLPVVTNYVIQATEKEQAEAIENLRTQIGEHSHPETVAEGDTVFGIVSQGDFSEKTGIPTKKLSAEGLAKIIGAKKEDVIVFDVQSIFADIDSLRIMLGKTKENITEVSGEYTFVVEDISRKELAELNQVFFDKAFGEGTVSNEDEFRAKVMEAIQENYKREAEYLLDDHIYDALLANTSIELPEEFLQRWLLTQDGYTEERIEAEFEKFLKDLRWTLIRNYVAEQSDIKVANEEIETESIVYMKNQFGLSPTDNSMDEVLRKMSSDFLKRENGENYMRIFNRVYAEKVMAILREKVKTATKNIDVEEFKGIASA